MTSDLISRQAAIMHFVSAAKKYECGMFDLKEATHELWEVPSAEPEIIRCKDCLIHGVCRFEQGLGLDGYCSQAERRTDE